MNILSLPKPPLLNESTLWSPQLQAKVSQFREWWLYKTGKNTDTFDRAIDEIRVVGTHEFATGIVHINQRIDDIRRHYPIVLVHDGPNKSGGRMRNLLSAMVDYDDIIIPVEGAVPLTLSTMYHPDTRALIIDDALYRGEHVGNYGGYVLEKTNLNPQNLLAAVVGVADYGYRVIQEGKYRYAPIQGITGSFWFPQIDQILTTQQQHEYLTIFNGTIDPDVPTIQVNPYLYAKTLCFFAGKEYSKVSDNFLEPFVASGNFINETNGTPLYLLDDTPGGIYPE